MEAVIVIDPVIESKGKALWPKAHPELDVRALANRTANDSSAQAVGRKID